MHPRNKDDRSAVACQARRPRPRLPTPRTRRARQRRVADRAPRFRRAARARSMNKTSIQRTTSYGRAARAGVLVRPLPADLGVQTAANPRGEVAVGIKASGPEPRERDPRTHKGSRRPRLRRRSCAPAACDSTAGSNRPGDACAADDAGGAGARRRRQYLQRVRIAKRYLRRSDCRHARCPTRMMLRAPVVLRRPPKHAADGAVHKRGRTRRCRRRGRRARSDTAAGFPQCAR